MHDVHLVRAPNLPQGVLAWVDHRSDRVYVDPSLLHNNQPTAEGRQQIDRLLKGIPPPPRTE